MKWILILILCFVKALLSFKDKASFVLFFEKFGANNPFGSSANFRRNLKDYKLIFSMSSEVYSVHLKYQSLWNHCGILAHAQKMQYLRNQLVNIRHHFIDHLCLSDWKTIVNTKAILNFKKMWKWMPFNSLRKNFHSELWPKHS